MYSKEEILNCLQVFLNYSISKDSEHITEYTENIEKIRVVVNDYFSYNRSNLKTLLNAVQLALYSDILKRNTTYSKITPTMPPEETQDIRTLFYDYTAIINTSNDVFFNSWIQSSDSETGTVSITGNSLIEKWILEINESINGEYSRIESYYNELAIAGSDAGMVMLWEDLGEVVKTINTAEIADIVFNDYGFAEAITVLNLPCYKPTFV